MTQKTSSNYNPKSCYFKKQGAGAPVVLLHGWGGNHNSWHPVFEELKKDFQVFSLDLPGFGNSPVPTKTWNLEDYAHFLKSFLDQENLSKINLIGHSFGGQIGIKFAKLFPQHVEKLILADSAGIRNPKSFKNLTYLALAKSGKRLLSLPFLKRFKKQARKKLYDQIGEHDYEQAGKLREIFKKAIGEDLKEDLKEITVPTLIIWGERDYETPLKDGALINKLIPGSKLEVIKNAGHFSYLDQPGKFCTIVKENLHEKES